jgi:hypothetical protein
MSKKSVIFSQIYVFENSFGIYKMNLSRHDTTHEARPGGLPSYPGLAH